MSECLVKANGFVAFLPSSGLSAKLHSFQQLYYVGAIACTTTQIQNRVPEQMECVLIESASAPSKFQSLIINDHAKYDD